MIRKVRVGVLISGRGSNMTALIKAANSADYPVEIVGVISNRAAAQGLETANNAGIETAVIPLKDYADRTAADAAMTETLESWNIEVLCLAGFMRILSAEFVQHWQGRAINIHPSLLPRHKGLDTHQRAIDAGDREHGCSVHFVVAELDAGPVIAQARVAVLPEDTAETLAARVLNAEHRLYPHALAAVASREVWLEDGRLRRR